MSVRPVPVVLSIAGSDSGGGAGIQADLKAFARAGVHGTTAITAITVQNTVGVTHVHPVPPDLVREQVRVVAADLGVDAVKIGMLGDAATIRAVARALDELPAGTPVVLDPVMVAESGARLLAEDAAAALAADIVPRATVITPNVPEARALTGLGDEATPEELVRALHALGPQVAVLTGGHRDEATDLVFDGTTLTAIPGERHPDGAAHGSGCTHASTLAARLALGDDVLTAARAAKDTAAAAIRDGLREIGQGAGPVDVFGLRHAAPPAPAEPPAATTPGLPPTGTAQPAEAGRT
jgi:hydroxymethylpyrimidine/phosphomethylpyrimidine kinase